MGVHLALIRYQGISSLSRTDEPEPTAEVTAGRGGKPFFPHHALKDLTTMYLALGVMVTLALLFQVHLGDPVDLLVTPVGIKPEWYFLPPYQLLKYVPKAVGVQVPPLFLLLLMAVPLVIDTSPERHPRRRLGIIAGSLVVAIVVVGLGVLGHISETTQTILGRTYHFDVLGWPREVMGDRSRSLK